MFGYEWWSTPVFDDNIDSEELSDEKIRELLSLIGKLQNEGPGAKLSNIGGWQSNSIHKGDHAVTDHFIEIFQKRIDAIADEFKSSMRVSNMWINVNLGGDHNVNHSHPISMYSGVFYLQATEDQGNLVMVKPHYEIETHALASNRFREYLDKTSMNQIVKPETRKLFLFPSHISHFVQPNRTNTERISIAFNTIHPDISVGSYKRDTNPIPQKQSEGLSEAEKTKQMWGFMDK